jgi:hypothetical protein
VRGDFKKWALGLGLLSVGATACVDPKADYEEFLNRPVVVREAGTVDVAQSPCQEVLAQNLNGKYFGSCLVKTVGTPFSLAVEQTVVPSADGMTGEIAVSFTALRTDAKTMADTAGETTVLKPVPVDSECRYREDVGRLVLPAAANSFGTDLESLDVVLRGKLLTKDRSCSELDGRVPLAGVTFNDDGDICIYQRAPDDGSLLTIPSEEYVCDPSLLLPR